MTTAARKIIGDGPNAAGDKETVMAVIVAKMTCPPCREM